MTLEQFIKEYTGKYTDFDGIYPNQCMDLVHFYVYKVLGITDKSVLAAPSARLVYENFRWPDLFKKIPNTPLGVPISGDIVVWGTEVGQHGHIAVFLEGDVNSFKSFDANYPVGTLPHIQDHTYKGVLGWLRPMTPCSELEERLQKVTDERDKYIIEDKELRLDIKRLEKENKTLAKNLEDLSNLYQKLLDDDKIEDEDHRKLLNDYDKLLKEYNGQKDQVFKLSKSNEIITNELDLTKEENARLHETMLTFGEIFDYFISWILRKIFRPKGGGEK